MADTALRTSMAMAAVATSQTARATKPSSSSSLRFPALRLMTSLSYLSKPYTLSLPSIPKRDFKLEAKKKAQTVLVSTEGTGYFYVTAMTKEKLTKNPAIRKYDPRLRRHVVFVPKLMKSSPPKKRLRTKRRSRAERSRKVTG